MTVWLNVPKGTRVKWSTRGKNTFRQTDTAREGTFLRPTSDGCLVIAWDGRKTTQRLHPNFVDQAALTSAQATEK